MDEGVILAVEFVDGRVVGDCINEAKHVTCSMTFMASKPVSINDNIIITDSVSGKRYVILGTS